MSHQRPSRPPRKGHNENAPSRATAHPSTSLIHINPDKYHAHRQSITASITTSLAAFHVRDSPRKKSSVLPAKASTKPSTRQRPQSVPTLANVTNTQTTSSAHRLPPVSRPLKPAPAPVTRVKPTVTAPAPTARSQVRPPQMTSAPVRPRSYPTVSRISSTGPAPSSNGLHPTAAIKTSTIPTHGSFRKTLLPNHSVRTSSLPSSKDRITSSKPSTVGPSRSSAPRAPSAPRESLTGRVRAPVATPAQKTSKANRISIPDVTSSVSPAQAASPMRRHTNVSSRRCPLIPAVPLFDSFIVPDTEMKGVGAQENVEDHPDVMPDMDLDIFPGVEDFDLDPTLVHEYQQSIFAYKREMEIKLLPDPYYMDRQIDLNWHYRVQLIEWLAQVHERFDLLQETLHLCVNYLDRFLSVTIIPVGELQLAGMVALLLASKYEEIRSPSVATLAKLANDTYDEGRIRSAEIGMLQSLRYDMGSPGPMSFIRRISKADNYDVEIRTLTKYLIDVTLWDHRFIALPSSMIGAVGYCTSLRLLNRGPWTAEHEFYSGYEESTLSAAIQILLTMLERPLTTHPTLFQKYQDERFMHCSDFVQGLGQAELRALH